MEPAIHTRALRREFKTRQRGFSRASETRVALEGLDLTIERGERVAYIGPNGAGKSTSIKILTGILHPTSGEATVLGLTPWKHRVALTRRLGAVFGQRSQLLAELPARDSFELVSHVYKVERSVYQKRLANLSEQFEAEHLIDHPVRAMSLGERMRCELIASLLHAPEILLLDEPTIGLDLIAKRTLRELIVRANEQDGLTVILTSHDVADVEHVADRVVVIDHGRMVYDGGVGELRRDFLQSKLVDVQFADEQDPPADVAGCTFQESTTSSLRFVVDVSQRGIGDALNELVAQREVEDITISDPPLEDVIETIYRRSGSA
jgi:ABC-2 type transport system ATP-binding protein